MRKKNKKSNHIKRATKTVLRFMDQIFQKHRDTHPMGEGFFEDFKEDFDIESYLKPRIFKTTGKGGNFTHSAIKSKSEVKGYESYIGLQGVGLYIMSALEIMELAYDSHAQKSNPEKEKITLNA